MNHRVMLSNYYNYLSETVIFLSKSASTGHPGYYREGASPVEFLTLTSNVSSSKFKVLQEKTEKSSFLSVTQ